uniref:Uncharacterized protein n=1 Tax=Rhizophora mucronata TaxID=61149 RepID=A0A2P2Q6D7_RHIMU
MLSILHPMIYCSMLEHMNMRLSGVVLYYVGLRVH